MKKDKLFEVVNALPLRRVPDLDMQQRLRNMANRPIPLPDELPVTEQQQHIRQCAEGLKKLQQTTELTDIIASVVALRRSYVVFYTELQNILQRELAKDDTLPPQLVDFVAQYALYLAAKPFDTTELVEGIMQVFLPSLVDVVARHAAEEQEARNRELVEAERQRRITPVDIGITHTPMQGNTLLERAQSLVLVGPGNAIRWLAKHVERTAKKSATVVRLTTTSIQPGDQEINSLKLGLNAWQSAAKNIEAFRAAMRTYLQPMLSRPVDLVICDSMSMAAPPLFTGQSPFSRANDALRVIRMWCNEVGATFVGGVGTSAEDADFSSPVFEGLKTHSIMRPVGLTHQGEGPCRITVGDGASVFDAPHNEVAN